jgi:hypothetical protein
MLSTIFVFIFLLAFSLWFGQYLHDKNPGTKLGVFRGLILYHITLSLVYYLYTLFNRSDAIFYFIKVDTNFRGESWSDFYGVSTIFIEFVGYPFIKFFGFSFEAMMILFAWFGLLGFFYFYIVLNERLRYRHQFFGYDLLTIILFLPNLHFWSGSFGKGSIIFLGFGLYFYALNKINERWIAGIIGAIIIYHVRPHILFVVMLASAWGFIFSTRGISFTLRFIVILASFGAFYFIKEDVLALTGINEEELFEESTTLSHRAYELSKSGSGVDLSGYSLPMKVFTFWFRPLFIDAPGMLGIIVSFENIFYLIIFLKLFRWSFIDFFKQADHVVKASFLTFLGVSFALAQISGNLGIAMRQKSQVMILMMFVILKFMDEQKYWGDLRKEQREKIKANRAGAAKRRVAGRKLPVAGGEGQSAGAQTQVGQS